MVGGVIVGAVAVLALGWVWFIYRRKAEDRALDMQLHAVIMEARRVLSAEELEVLRLSGIELEKIGRAHVREGTISPKEAARTTKRAIIQSAYASLEISKTFRAGEARSSSVLFD